MISFVIPTLNEEKVIESTIRSLKENLTLPHEVIISDGHSTDRTVELAGALADQLLVHDGTHRQTIAQGRNLGAQAAKGEFLVFLDADCIIEHPTLFFQRAVQLFKEDPKLVALTGAVLVHPRFATIADRMVLTLYTLWLRFLNNTIGLGAATGEFQMMRTETFHVLGGFREDLVASEDADMFLRLAKKGKTLLDPTLVVYHTGRRAHKVGWPKLLSQWIMNGLTVFLAGKSYSKEWKVIR